LKAKMVLKGFIDPRRPDTFTINFDIKEWSAGSSYNWGVLLNFLKSNEWILKKFKPRAYWFEVEVERGRLFNFSGNGPEPEYPCPDGDIVNLSITI
jgi:hypothetical protein